MTIRIPMCFGCKHWIRNYKCDAFPNRIPDEILKGEADHTKPYPGDNGIRFEPIPKAPNERKSA